MHQIVFNRDDFLFDIKGFFLYILDLTEHQYANVYLNKTIERVL